VLTRERFEAARREIAASGPASTSDNLSGMEADCCAFLGDPAFADQDPRLWHDMTVAQSEGAEWLITGTAHGKSHDADAIAAELRRIWQDRLRYPCCEAHTIVQRPDEVALLAVTQMSPGGLWVTAKVTVRLADDTEARTDHAR
jgi:hypothetical protein